MSDTRVTAADRGEGFSFHFDDVEVRSYPGESVAGALMAAGISVLRHTGKAKGGQMHILRKPFELFASFPVTARCPGCTRLNLRNSG